MRKIMKKRIMAMGVATVLMVSCTFTDSPGVFSPTIAYAATETVLWEHEGKVTSNEVTFADAEDWDNIAQVAFDGTQNELATGTKLSFTMTISKESYESLKDGYIKLEADIFQEKDNWDTMIKAGWPELKQSIFSENEDGTYSTDYSMMFDEGGIFASLLIRAVGTNFKGTISYDNVKITKEEEKELTKQEPTVVSSFDTGTDGWVGEAGYEYSNGDENSTSKNEKPEVTYDEDGKQLKIHLDYSADATTGWSEAKVTKGLDQGIDVSNYNLLTFMVTYPETFSLTAKVFAKGGENDTEIINKQAEVVANSIQDLGNGKKCAKVKVTFTPNEQPLESITIGFVGQNTDFVGDVYLDDVTVAQQDASENFVSITSKVKEEVDTADISAMPSEVTLVDGDATKETKVLASYLKSLIEKDQVLFGHQNSTFRSVKDNGTTSDVEDMVGSLPAIVGMDSLALSGCEISATSQKEALEKSVAASKKGYENGAIITLSCHMPNFTNDKITKNADGTYDFTKCDFAESKDCTNNCADQILQGGAYNDVYNAYLDMIADYALQLQEDNIPILFRPFHENNGSWFWWGTTTSVESYKAIYRYMVDYLKEKGVHNLLYVYSPNGPISSEEEYDARYPGDEYIDIVAFDYYDDYSSYPAEFSEEFFENLETTCTVVADFAKKHNKIPAISETGCRVTRSNGDYSGLAITENPIAGHDWYTQVMKIAQKTGMPYYMVWANFDDSNFFVPYKYNDTLGQEMINEFIEFYNQEGSIFANGTNFYGEDGALGKVVNADTYENVRGYLITPKDYAVIKEPMKLQASVQNVKDKVEFQIRKSETETPVVVTATKNSNGIYEAQLDAETLKNIGKTDEGIITLVADQTALASSKFISFNKEKEVAPLYNIDDFEYYLGNDALLSSTYGEPNSAANCTSSFKLDSDNKINGNYGGAFNYSLTYKGSEVWTGLGKALNNTDYSKYNAFSMWVKPDGNGQKLVIQFVSNNEEFEVYLSDFVKGTKAQYVTIPFSSLKGKKNGTFDSSNVTKFAVWCNSKPENYTGTKDEKGNYKVNGTIVFDEIKAIGASNDDLKKVDGNGLIITDQALKDTTVVETISVTGVKLSATTKEITTGSKYTLKATLSPSNATNKTVTWSSSKKEVATVNSDGVVTGLKAGTTDIKVTTKDGNYSATCKVTVQDAGVKLNVTKKEITTGSKFTLKATVSPSNAANKTVTWSSSKKEVATVNSNGVVTGLKAGTTDIKATTKDGKYSATCRVTVKDVKVTKLVLNETKATLEVGKTKTLKVKEVRPGNATNKKVTWSTSNTKVAKVSSSGKVTAVGAGKAVIKVTAKDGSKVYAACTITVKPNQVTGIKAKNIKKTSLTLTWKKQSGVSGYNVYRYDKKTNKYKKIKTVKTNQVTLTGLSKNTKYKYKVVAYKNVGKTTYVGKDSKIVTVTTKR